MTFKSKELFDLEELAVLEYLNIFPAPFPEYLYEKSGNICKDVKESYNYLGLVDGLLGRPSKEAIILGTSDALGYHFAYEKGSIFRIKKKLSSIN